MPNKHGKPKHETPQQFAEDRDLSGVPLPAALAIHLMAKTADKLRDWRDKQKDGTKGNDSGGQHHQEGTHAGKTGDRSVGHKFRDRVHDLGV